jgi:protoporphyrinogen oxidase
VGGFILDPYEVKRRELIRLQIEIEDMIDFSQGIQKLEEELERQRKITKYSVNIQEKIREIEKEIEREESEREREREKGP